MENLLIIDENVVLSRINNQIDVCSQKLAKLEFQNTKSPNSISISNGIDTKVIEFTKSEKIRNVMNELEILFQMKEMIESINNSK